MRASILILLARRLAVLGPWVSSRACYPWDGIKNSIPDVQAFIKDVKDYISTIEFHPYGKKSKIFLSLPGK